MRREDVRIGQKVRLARWAPSQYAGELAVVVAVRSDEPFSITVELAKSRRRLYVEPEILEPLKGQDE